MGYELIMEDSGVVDKMNPVDSYNRGLNIQLTLIITKLKQGKVVKLYSSNGNDMVPSM